MTGTRSGPLPFLLGVSLWLAGCGQQDLTDPGPRAVSPVPATAVAAAPPRSPRDLTRERIRLQEATREEVLDALEEDEVRGLANTVHVLYFMAGAGWVRDLLQALWEQDLRAYPTLHWGRLSAPAVRVALASTLARLDPPGREVFLAYLRQALSDPESFVRAQAAVGLGLSGTDEDAPRIEALARGGGPYDAEAAVKALAILGTEAGRAALLRLRADPAIDPRRRAVARQVLLEVFPDSAGPGGAPPADGAPP